MRRSWSLALALLPALAACGGSRPPSRRPSAARRRHRRRPSPPADLKARISIFADDSMQGRRAGTPGNVRGNAYIAAELARLGLKPAGDGGGFLQRVPLTSYALDTAAAALHAGSATLAPFADYYPYQPIFAVPVRPIDGAPVVYLGTKADSAALPAARRAQGQARRVPRARPRATRSARPTWARRAGSG